MKYCVIKNIEGNLTTGIITQGEEVELLIEQALKTEFNGRFLTENDIVILTEEEYQIRVENAPKPPQEPTLEEKNRADIDYLAIMSGVDL